MKRFKSVRQLQRFVWIYDPIANLYHFSRHSLNASEYPCFAQKRRLFGKTYPLSNSPHDENN